ncbi:MAG: hypothetical protein WA085_07370 [Sphingobium sp.]
MTSNEGRRSNEEQLRLVLSRFFSDAGVCVEAVDDGLVQALASSVERATETTTENVEEIVGGDDPNSMSMIYIRHGRRTAKSIHFRNFSADATTATQATLVALTGTPAIATILSSGLIGATFLPFVIGMAFTLYKTLEKTIGWPESCLFFALHQVANFHDFVSDDVAKSMGPVLRDQYGYAKGENTNEVDDLLDKLQAHGALRKDVGGYRLMEGVTRSWIDWAN